MRTRLIVAVMALAVCAQATSVSSRTGSTHKWASDWALEPGAVYELSLRVSWANVEEYLSLYAKWFFHVDVASNSGRKLLSILTRELGDDHNLVFVYWYESPYKEHYYCQYAREFFAYHLGNDATKTELRTMYDDAARLFGAPHFDDAAILAELRQCKGNELPVIVGETIRKVDDQFRRLVVSDEASWNIGVNPCRVQKISDADKNKRKITPSELQSCDETAVLILERYDPRRRKARIETCPHVMLARAVCCNWFREKRLCRLERHIAAEKLGDKRHEKDPCADQCRDGIARQTEATLLQSADVAGPEEERLSRAHRDFVEFELRACLLESRADKIVIADGRPADRHQNVGALGAIQRFRKRVE